MKERIGDYMVRTGAMKQAQVDDVARVEAGGDTRHFGGIAVSLGSIKTADVDAYLATQK